MRHATGRTLIHRDASLVCTRGEDVVLAARDAEPVIRSLPDVALGVSDATTDFALGYKQAAACARLAATRGGGVVRTDQLGPLRFLLDAPDVEQVRAVVAEQLGPLVAHEGPRRPARHAARVRRRRRQRRRKPPPRASCTRTRSATGSSG